MDDIKKLKYELEAFLEAGSDKDITAARGRLIERYKKEIKKLLNKKDLSPEEKENLSIMKEELEKEIGKHKIQLSARYSKEFLNKKAGVLSVVNLLPNAVSIAIDKVKACINDLKNAKDNKEKTQKKFEVLKSVGSLAATPFVYLGKFALDQWYAIAGAGAIWYFKDHPEELIGYIKNLFGEEAGLIAKVAIK
jgi:vacuolar-type H+-ATPase subunit I/STV1